MFCTHSRKIRQVCKLAQTASARFSTYAAPTPSNSTGSYQTLQQEKDSWDWRKLKEDISRRHFPGLAGRQILPVSHLLSCHPTLPTLPTTKLHQYLPTDPFLPRGCWNPTMVFSWSWFCFHIWEVWKRSTIISRGALTYYKQRHVIHTDVI